MYPSKNFLSLFLILSITSCTHKSITLIEEKNTYPPSEIYAEVEENSKQYEDHEEDIYDSKLNVEGNQNVLTSANSTSGSLMDRVNDIGYFSQKQVLKDSADVKEIKDMRTPWDSYATKHPDGSQYFLSSRKEIGSTETNYYISLYKVNPTTYVQEKVMELPDYKMNETNIADVFASVSPDGMYYVYTKRADIYSINLGTKKVKNITNTPDITERAPFFQIKHKERIYYSVGKEKEISSIHTNYTFN